MKVWIAKYSLTKGIFEAEVEDCGGGMVSGKSNGFPVCYHGQGIEWCKTKAAAIARAEEMRKKKISSLKNQIDKLEKMKFDCWENNMKETWVLCPICHNKTRTKLRPDTEAKNLIVFCPKCKRESVVDIKDMESKVVKE